MRNSVGSADLFCDSYLRKIDISVSLQIVVEKCHMTRRYLPRIADKVLCQALTASGAVCIHGPKWCGKTWTATQQAKSMLMMQDPDQAGNYMSIAEANPSLLLEGEVPRLPL